MNAQGNTVRLQVNEENLIQALRHSFTKGTTFIGELLQNARRAGASWVEILYQDGELVVDDDGCGVDDLQKLLTVAESGWKQEVIEQERPFGIGFLSSLFAAKYVIIESAGKRLEFDTNTVLSFQDIPVLASDVTGGAKITLRGIDLDDATVRQRVAQLAQGFPIPVSLNNKAVDRSDAVGGPLSFEETDIGLVALVDSAEDLRERLKSGTNALKVYLQGLPIYERIVWGNTQPNVVHLNPRSFFGRLPDRDCLQNQEESVKRIDDMVIGLWKERLLQWKREVSAEEFANKAYEALRKWHLLHLLNDIPYLPRRCLRQVTGYPIEAREWERDDIYSPVPQSVTREQVESGEIRIFDNVLDDYSEDDGWQVPMYLFGHKAHVLDEPLHGDHWVYDHLLEIDDEAVSLSIMGLEKEERYIGNYVSADVAFCREVALDGPIGPVKFEHDAFVFSGRRHPLVE